MIQRFNSFRETQILIIVLRKRRSELLEMNIVIYITQKINKNWNFVKNCESKILETYKIVLLLRSKEMFLFLVYSYSSSFSKAGWI